MQEEINKDLILICNQSDTLKTNDDLNIHIENKKYRIPRLISDNVKNSKEDTTQEDSKTVLLMLGFKEIKVYNPLYYEAIFPKGWRMIPIENSLSSFLLDNKDRRRAKTYCKTVFYSKEVDIEFLTRFSYECKYESESIVYEEQIITPYTGYVYDSGEIVYITESIKNMYSHGRENANWKNIDFWSENSRIEEKINNDCLKWLSRFYPEWKDKFAYWEI